jgi:hypothetical protein
MIVDLVCGAWLRYVRQENLELIGETTDLAEFLFGSERSNSRWSGRCLKICNAGSAFIADVPYGLAPQRWTLHFLVALSRGSRSQFRPG